MSTQYPIVPNVEGVPQVNRSSSYSSDNVISQQSSNNGNYSGQNALQAIRVGDVDMATVSQQAVVQSQNPNANIASQPWDLSGNRSGGVMNQDSIPSYQIPTTLKWGAYDNENNPILTGGIILALDYRKGYRIANHPIEQGAFASFNKLTEPFDIRISIAVDGILGQYGSQLANRGEWIDRVNNYLNGLDIFKVVTPEVVFRNCNLVDMSWSRQRGNETLLVVELHIQEVRIVSALGFTSTSNSEGADPINGGSPQTRTPSPTQTPVYASAFLTSNLTPAEKIQQTTETIPIKTDYIPTGNVIY